MLIRHISLSDESENDSQTRELLPIFLAIHWEDNEKAG